MKLTHLVLTVSLSVSLGLTATAQEPAANPATTTETQQPATSTNANPSTPTSPATANPGGKSDPSAATDVPSNGGKSKTRDGARHQRHMHIKSGLSRNSRPGGTRERGERGEHHHRTPRRAP